MTMTDFKPLDARKALTLRKQVLAFREHLHQEVHPLQILVFLEVCNTPAYTVSAKYIEELLCISQASASRHCRIMLDRMSPSKQGYGLCRWVQDDNCHRSKYLELTEQGIELREKLRELF